MRRRGTNYQYFSEKFTDASQNTYKTSQSKFAQITYFQHLGGFLPILKGRKTSKIKPEFVIFDPLRGGTFVILVTYLIFAAYIIFVIIAAFAIFVTYHIFVISATFFTITIFAIFVTYLIFDSLRVKFVTCTQF